MKLDLPVMATVLIVSIALQEGAPSWPEGGVKWPFLTAVVAYYAIQRECSAALTAAVWSGVLTDASDGLPLVCTAGYLVVLVLALRHARATMRAHAVWQGMVAVSLAAPLQMFWQAVFGGVLPPEGGTFGRLFASAALAAPYGAAAAFLVFNVVGALDRLAGNVKGSGQTDGVS